MPFKYLKQAITILNQGGIIIFPTDTAFGIGCRIDNKQAIERLFKLRKRPEHQATPVLVSDLEMTQKYLLPIEQEIREKLIRPYWPGALTIILPCKKAKVFDPVRGNSDTLGVRMPNSEICLEIIKGVGVPILGPSANFHGGSTPFSFLDLDKDLVRHVDFIVPGECSLKQVSTVIDCSVEPWKILRQGGIKI
jgi:L-threonylcarbamoyladenylate synthase